VIELKDDAPTSINCRVYPLSPKEKEEQHKFLSQNLRLQRIHHSKSPYASGFFHIQKERWQISSSPRLSQSQQMDDPKQISIAINLGTHL